MIFFKDKLFVKPRSFQMLAMVAHQIVTGGFNPGIQRKEGNAFEKWSKTREPSKMGGVGSTLAYLRLELPHRPHGQVLPRKIFFEAKMKFSILYNLRI